MWSSDTVRREQYNPSVRSDSKFRTIKPSTKDLPSNMKGFPEEEKLKLIPERVSRNYLEKLGEEELEELVRDKFQIEYIGLP